MTATPATGRITQEQATWFAHTFDQLVGNIEQGRPRQAARRRGSR